MDIFEVHKQHHQSLAAMKEAKKNRAKEMLEYRYAVEPARSYAEIAKKFGVSRQRVYQIVSSFI